MSEDTDRATATDPAAMIKALLLRHRSIRKYKAQEVAPELIEQACRHAIAGSSSSGNMNLVSIICSRDAGRRKALCRLHFYQPMVEQAPLVLTFCADSFRMREWLGQRQARLGFGNLLSYHVAAFDALIVAQSVALVFEAHGLGICYMGTTLHSMPEIAALLELPDHCLPVTSMVVGWPDEAPEARDRLPLQGMLHDETYQKPSADDIDRLYADREIAGWNRYRTLMPERFAEIDQAGIRNLAQFYTSDLKYAPPVFERDSAKMAAFLAERGFMP